MTCGAFRVTQPGPRGGSSNSRPKEKRGGGNCSESTRLSTSLHESPDLHCKPLLLGAPSLLAVPLGLEATQHGNDSFQLVEVIKHIGRVVSHCI